MQIVCASGQSVKRSHSSALAVSAFALTVGSWALEPIGVYRRDNCHGNGFTPSLSAHILKLLLPREQPGGYFAGYVESADT
jgi:hypothetical protein